MSGSNNDYSYRISCGYATVTPVTLGEIASVVGLRRNSPKLRELFDDVREGINGLHTCVHAAHLLLKAEHERIGAPFELVSYTSVATVFWHAYANLDGAIEFIGEPKKVARMLKNAGSRSRLASQLTGNPGVHRFLYRASSGLMGAALDRHALVGTDFDPVSVIDLEQIARRVMGQLGRPLLTLRLKPARPAANDEDATLAA